MKNKLNKYNIIYIQRWPQEKNSSLNLDKSENERETDILSAATSATLTRSEHSGTRRRHRRGEISSGVRQKRIGGL